MTDEIDERAYYKALQPTFFASGKQPGSQFWLRKFLKEYEAAKPPMDYHLFLNCINDHLFNLRDANIGTKQCADNLWKALSPYPHAKPVKDGDVS